MNTYKQMIIVMACLLFHTPLMAKQDTIECGGQVWTQDQHNPAYGLQQMFGTQPKQIVFDDQLPMTKVHSYTFTTEDPTHIQYRLYIEVRYSPYKGLMEPIVLLQQRENFAALSDVFDVSDIKETVIGVGNMKSVQNIEKNQTQFHTSWSQTLTLDKIQRTHTPITHLPAYIVYGCNLKDYPTDTVQN